MTAVSVTPARPISQAGAGPVGRNALFFGLFLLAALNALAGSVIESVSKQGLASAAFVLFGQSAIVWVALAAGLAILAGEPRETGWRRLDGTATAATLAAAALPLPNASALALTALAAWAVLTGGKGSAIRRAGIVFAAMSGTLIWGRLILAMFSRPLLDIDAMFVAGLLGVEHSGNALRSSENGFRLLVAPGCSSLHGLSLSLLLWATITQYYRVPFGRRASLMLAGALGATVFVNVVRIGAMLRWPEHFREIHIGWGAAAAAWLTLVAVAAICLYGARREIFSRG